MDDDLLHRLRAQYDCSICRDAVVEIERLRNINSGLVRNFNAANLHGARQDAEIKRLKAELEIANDGLTAAYLAGAQCRKNEAD